MCVKGLWLCLQWSGHLFVTPCDGWVRFVGVGGGGGGCGDVVGEGGVYCNVASAEEIFMYLLDRCEVCV